MNKFNHAGPQSHGRSLAYKQTQRLTLETQGLQQKAVAIDLNVDGANLCRYLADTAPEVTMPIHRLLPWYRATGDLSLLRQIVADHGYELLMAEEHGDSLAKSSPQRLMAMLSFRSGDLLAHLIQAVEDGQISAEERRNLYPEAANLLAVVQALVDRLHPRSTNAQVSA